VSTRPGLLSLRLLDNSLKGRLPTVFCYSHLAVADADAGELGRDPVGGVLDLAIGRNLPAIGNAMYAGSDQVFMYSGSEVPQQEYRSYVDDEDSDEYLAPDPFALPVPTPPEQEDK